MNRAVATVFILLFEACALGQIPERATTPMDFALYGGVIATRAIDYISTEKVLAAGGQELLLPRFLVTSKPAFAAFSTGSGLAEIYVSRILRKTRPKIARYLLIGDVVSAGLVAVHNGQSVPRTRK
jgi:hypothetical protein